MGRFRTKDRDVSFTSYCAQALDVLISFTQLLGQKFVLILELLYDLWLGVIILSWFVRNLRRLCRIVDRTEILIIEPIIGRDATYHESVTIPSQGLPQQACQLGVSVRHKSLGFGNISQCSNHLSQREQTLVDVDALFGQLVSGTSVGLSLWPC